MVAAADFETEEIFLDLASAALEREVDGKAQEPPEPFRFGEEFTGQNPIQLNEDGFGIRDLFRLRSGSHGIPPGSICIR